MPPQAQQIARLITAAHDRNIPLSDHDIRTLRDASPDSTLGKWLDKFDPTSLQPALQQPQSSRPRPPASALSPTAPTAPLSPTQLSTLTHQKALLKSHIHSRQHTQALLTRHTNTLRDRTQTTTQQLSRANASKLAELKTQLLQRQSELEKQAEGFAEVGREILGRGEREVRDLQERVDRGTGDSENFDGPSRVCIDVDVDKEKERVEKLLTALEVGVIQGIKARLDRVFLESLGEGTNTAAGGGGGGGGGTAAPTTATTATTATDSGAGEGSGQRNGSQDLRRGVLSSATNYDNNDNNENDEDDAEDENTTLRNLHQEIQTLYTEIPSMTSILVAKNHGEPIRRNLKALETAQREARNAVLMDAKERIWGMTKEMDELSREIEENYGERVVVGRLIGELRRVEGRKMDVEMRERDGEGRAEELARGGRRRGGDMIEKRNGDEGQIMGQVDQDDEGEEEEEDEQGDGHDQSTQALKAKDETILTDDEISPSDTISSSITSTMQQAAHQRRQAVDMLVEAVTHKSTASTALERDVRILEEKIAETKGRIVTLL